MGVAWQLEETSLVVQGTGLNGLRSPDASLNCGNSATTIRMLTGAIAASGIHVVLDGSDGLRRRPMNRIVDPLQKMGVPIAALDGKAPLTLMERAKHFPLKAVTHELNVASAQVKSCLLLAALAAGGATTIVEPGPSRDHTERLLSSMGITIEKETLVEGESYKTILTPSPEKSLTPLNLTLPGDISSAAFLLVSALITPGSEVTIQDVGLNPTRTGIIDALVEMGGDITIANRSERHNEPVGDITVRHSQLKGIEVNGSLVVRMIDEFPAFAIAAAYADGETVVTEAIELRHKESDRITALCEQLRNVGVDVEELEDGFKMKGNTPPSGGDVDPHGDHRLAMSLAVSGLGASAPVTIHDPQIIHESFPGFKATLEFLGARLDG
jgi:3-phosphoshikimate 1-carboxyvinyltransferase